MNWKSLAFYISVYSIGAGADAVKLPDAPPVKANAEVVQSAQIEKPAAQAKAPLSGVTCDKGESIVASYGFLDISEKTCSGSSLVYSAVRGNSNYEVEVNSANGEVTAVRKVT